jgi:hypothetical protein
VKRIWTLIPLFLVGLIFLVGCSSKPPTPGPLTEEQKQKIKEEDRNVDDEERSGSGTATPIKRR